MQVKALLIALAASLTTVTSQSTCHSYVILSIRGTYELQGPSIAFPGMINSTLHAIPGGVEYDVVYPAAPNQTAYLGSDDATRYINASLQDCPNQKYAILGYSQGASATLLTLEHYTDPASAAYKAIRAVLVVGNPFHVPNASVNIDEFGGDSTRSFPGSAYNANQPGARGIPQIYYDNGELLDICHTEDLVCAPGYPNATFAPGHLHYGDKNVQELGAKFLISRLGGNSTVSNSTTSGVAKPTGTGSFAPKPTGTGSVAPKPSGTGSTAPKPTGSSPPSGTGAVQSNSTAPASYPSRTAVMTGGASPSATVEPSFSSASVAPASSFSVAVSVVLAGIMILLY